MTTNVFGMGKGVGEYSFYSSASAHGIGWGSQTGFWGTANLGPFIYAFGIPTCVLLVLVLSLLIAKIIATNSTKIKVAIVIFIFANFSLLMFYGKILTFQGMMINYCLMLVAATVLKRKININAELVTLMRDSLSVTQHG